MAATVLSTQATAYSTFVVTVTFRDENASLVTPNTVTWKLTDADGVVINSRTAVSETPATAVDIVLQGDDLDPGGCDVAMLLLSVTAPYDSGLGSGLPLEAQCWILCGALEPSD